MFAAPGPAPAQEAAPPPAPPPAPEEVPGEAPGDMREGMGLVEEGLMLFFRGLVQEMEPALEDMAREMEPALKGFAEEMEPAMRRFVEEMGPRLSQLAELMGEMDDYHPPEKLPNGDIILRRKAPGETEPERRDRPPPGRLPPGHPPIDPEGEIEL